MIIGETRNRVAIVNQKDMRLVKVSCTVIGVWVERVITREE